MMTITAAMVKELRERTGSGMMECKKALVKADGDIEKAIEEMRKSGIAKAAKKAGRVAAEGMITMAVADDKQSAYMVEVNCETDFVTRDASFREFAQQLAARALAEHATDAQQLMQATYQEGQADTIEQARQKLITKIGENINIRRVAHLASTGCLGTYSHGNRIGVLVALDVDQPELAKDIAMHIAATNPQAVSVDDVPPELIQKEKDIFVAQAQESGKPAEIIEKMVTGRIAKYLKEVSLEGQAFVKNPDQTIAQLLQQQKAKVISFTRFEVGEGIEKRVEDFAKEVMAQVQGSE